MLLFTGTLNHPPNAEGIRWFADEVWPRDPRGAAGRVAARRRAATPRGRSPASDRGPASRSWAPCRHARRPTPAPRRWWSRCCRAAASRLKILEAIACGRAVASTSRRRRGARRSPTAASCSSPTAPSGFAAAALRLMEEPEPAGGWRRRGGRRSSGATTGARSASGWRGRSRRRPRAGGYPRRRHDSRGGARRASGGRGADARTGSTTCTRCLDARGRPGAAARRDDRGRQRLRRRDGGAGGRTATTASWCRTDERLGAPGAFARGMRARLRRRAPTGSGCWTTTACRRPEALAELLAAAGATESAGAAPTVEFGDGRREAGWHWGAGRADGQRPDAEHRRGEIDWAPFAGLLLRREACEEAGEMQRGLCALARGRGVLPAPRARPAGACSRRPARGHPPGDGDRSSAGARARTWRSAGSRPGASTTTPATGRCCDRQFCAARAFSRRTSPGAGRRRAQARRRGAPGRPGRGPAGADARARAAGRPARHGPSSGAAMTSAPPQRPEHARTGPRTELERVGACPACGSAAREPPPSDGLTDPLFGAPGRVDAVALPGLRLGLPRPPPDPRDDRPGLRALLHARGAADEPSRGGRSAALRRRALHGYLKARYGYDARRRPRWAARLLPLVPRTAALTDRWVRHVHRRGRGPRVLDVGCGNGVFMLRMRSLGFEVHGIDVDPAAVEEARRAGLDVRRGDDRRPRPAAGALRRDHPRPRDRAPARSTGLPAAGAGAAGAGGHGVGCDPERRRAGAHGLRAELVRDRRAPASGPLLRACLAICSGGPGSTASSGSPPRPARLRRSGPAPRSRAASTHWSRTPPLPRGRGCGRPWPTCSTRAGPTGPRSSSSPGGPGRDAHHRPARRDTGRRSAAAGWSSRSRAPRPR